MKKKSLLLGLIFALFALAGQAQIVEVYRQGFEATGETYGYEVTSGTAAPQNTYQASGSRALRMHHTNADAVFYTDTIDFTFNSSFAFLNLEFDHICDIDPTKCNTTGNYCIIEVKAVGDPNTTTWTRLNAGHYDINRDSYSPDFPGTTSFSNRSYNQWNPTANGQQTIQNTWWKHELFKLDTYIPPTQSQRKVQFRFTVPYANVGNQSERGWYIDNIVVRVSPSSMSLPRLKMAAWPEEMMPYPTSRAARIEADLTTQSTEGICLDSIYLLYTLSNAAGAEVYRQAMQTTSYTNNTLGNPAQVHVRGHIPFAGYDTIVCWRLVAKDNTANHNTATYPSNSDQWAHYYSTRGRNNQALLSSGGQYNLSNLSLLPFPGEATHKSQILFTQELMQQAGYGPGAVTGMTFTAASSATNSQRSRFVIRAVNVDENYSIGATTGNPLFYDENMKVLYDSSLVLSQNANTTITLNFQDTFFYAGKTALIQILSMSKNAAGNYFDPAGLQVKSFPTPTTTPSLWMSGNALLADNNNLDPLTSNTFQRGAAENKVPDGSLLCLENLPLIYDCGITGFVTPNDTITADANNPNDVIVNLKNFGVQPLNAVTIYYQVDGGAHQSFNWTGNLAGGATTQVTLSTTQTYSAGYHEMRAWVEDSILSGSTLYRDHEPFNDTAWTKMVSCAGAMHGERQVGGSNADYVDLEKFLYAVSRCGVDSVLHVKLAPGTYAPVAPTTIPGASQENYVQFEPLNGNASSVQFATNQANCTTPLLDLRNTRYLRFSQIAFRTTYANNITHPVRLGVNSVGCHFLGCSFTEEASTNTALANSVRATALLYSGGADSLVVDGCSFSRGNIGVSMVGPAADNLASGAIIRRSTFQNQGTNNFVVRNHISSIVDSNTMLNLITGAGYQMLFQDCHEAMQVTRNTAYVTSGSSCLGVTDFFGTATQGAIIANNMLICADDGTANMLTTPMFIISAEYTKIVHNSVKMTAPTRAGVAAAQFGGGEIDHCFFYNNIVSCFDTSNFALSYLPYGSNVNYIGNNIYFSRGEILNKYDGTICGNLNAWNTHLNDGASQQVNPAFLNLTTTDLSTYSLNVKGHGVPIAEVTDDIYGTARDSVAPCVGAFEFSDLTYDFEIVALVEPYDEYCNVPAGGAPLRLQIKNNGVNDYQPGVSGALTLTYSRTATPGQMVPGNSGNLQINTAIPGNSTVECSFNANLFFPTNGLLDTTYNFSFWLSSSIDVNHINDTSIFTVTARDHPTAPTAVNQNSPYGTAATVSVTQGIQTWPTQGYTSGRNDQSTIYWYADSIETTAPFHRGSTYTTDVLYEDTTFYVRQSRDLGVMRISEVQVKNNGLGATYPMPFWMGSATKFAVELINVGDYPANLLGDSIIIIHAQNNGNAGSNNNKSYRFPDVTVQPGQSIVVQFRANVNTNDSTVTLGATTVEPAGNAHFAVLYRDSQGIADAVAFNNITTITNSQNVSLWNNRAVPAAVWSGPGILMMDTSVNNNPAINTAGVTRIGWPSNPNANPSNSAQYWQMADSTHSMNIGENNSNLVLYTANGCLGDPAPVHIHLTNLPPADLALDSIITSEGCNLNLEPVAVTVHNFGSQNSGTFVLNCSVDGTLLCSDTLASLAPHGVVTHTFSQMANMYVPNGVQYFNICAWVDNVAGDNTLFNDTTRSAVLSSFTPSAPQVQTYDTVEYAGRLTLTTINPPADSLRWYNRRMTEVATVNNYLTPNIFRPDTFYVSALAPAPNDIHIGTLASVNGSSAYPSPFNPNKRYGQEQYLFHADELIAAGHQAGPITGLSFYLDTIRVQGGSITIDTFTLGIATTPIDAFNSANNTPSTKWQTIDQVYSQDNLTLSNASKGWIFFPFSTPFQWDGESNIVVGITRQMAAAQTAGAQTRYTAAFTGAAYYKNDANATIVLPGANGNGSLSASRPDVLFQFQDYGCEGPVSPIYVAVVGNPSIDASIEWPTEYDTLLFTSCGSTNIDLMVVNNGTDTLTNATIDYWIDGDYGMSTVANSIPFDSVARITIATPHLTPGRHHLRAAITVVGDTVPVNDTIDRIISVAFCGGTYTIGPSDSADYASIAVALDTLYGAGVAGPVVFNIESGTYRKQIDFGAIWGTSRTNTITFQSATGNAEDVTLVYDSITAARNYVLNIDGVKWLNFRRLHIFANGNLPAASNAIKITNSEQVHFTSCVIEVKNTTNNVNANGMLIYEGVRNLYVDSCEFSGGYYALRSSVATRNLTSGMYFTENYIHGFWYAGIDLRKVDEVSLRHNNIRGGVTISSRALTGISVAEVQGGINIERNNIVLLDNVNGGKFPIKVSNCVGTNIDRGRVYNNMCVGHGTGNATKGITIDSSVYINVYYNTVRVYGGLNQANTRAFSVEHSSSVINVLNNIFANFSRGYAYWLNNMNNVAQSNYNVFFSDTAAATRRLALIGSEELPDIDTLRLVTGKEPNSLFDQPYFEAADDLHLAYALYNEKALYLPDVTNDIDGESRPAIPAPCIGADEYTRCIHDVAIMQFIAPTLETDPYPIEGDTLWVTMKLFNNGTSTETNLSWHANIVGRPDLATPVVNIAEMTPSEVIFSTSYIVMPMGIIDTQRIEAFFSTDLPNDCAVWNNTADTVFFLDMAYDLMVTGNDAIEVTVDVGFGEGCRLWDAPVILTVTNKGHKPVPTNIPFTIGYEVRLPSTANYTVAQIPIVHEETHVLAQPIGINESVPITFATPVNIYPTGNSRDISVRIRGWVSHPNDQKPVGANSKDTTATIVGNNAWNSWKSVSSKYMPSAPTGNDLHIPYGTWDTIFASQGETFPGTTTGRPIMWYRDSTDAEPFHAPAQYARSCWWETPQYYHDSTYYLACVSASSCTSYYNPITVHVNPRVQNDVSIMSDTLYYDLPGLRHLNPVYQPYDKVYMTNDTVKVHIVNYGSNPVSNIPVYYQLRRANDPTVLQEVREVCTATIQPDSLYLFKFDSLVDLPWNNTNYSLRIWTDLASDPVRSNDTIRHNYNFATLPENFYETPSIGSPGGLDITHVSFSSLCVDIPEVWRDYRNFGVFDNPDFPVLKMIKGTTDTMIVEVANSDNMGDITTQGYITMLIDFDRNGVFDNTDPEAAYWAENGYTEIFFHDTISSRHPRKFVYTIPDDICLGYMRMRLVLQSDPGVSGIYSSLNFASGCVHDYLLYIEDVPEETDVAVSRIVSPVSRFITQDTTAVTVLLSNKGSSTITEAEIGYRIHHDTDITRNTFNWTGVLEPGTSIPVTLPGHHLEEGSSVFVIWANVYGDTISDNDTLRYEYNRFPVRTLIVRDHFVDNSVGWYAPKGFNAFSENLWQTGVPVKAHLNQAVSDSCVLATNINGNVNVGSRGNLSFYYSPLIDINQIIPDTISFYLASSLSDSSALWLEYYNYEHRWIKIGNANDSNWYNGGAGFVGRSPGYSYNRYSYSFGPYRSECPGITQFRLVYQAHPGASVDEGVVIDDIVFGRAQRAVDVGVVAITHPTEPRFGETIYPKVAIKNFGSAAINSVNLAYRPYGSNLPKTGTYNGVIEPGETKIYTFNDPFIVMADFPDTFQICAFTTVNMDIYWENDSTCKDFGLAPLDNDMGLVDFLYPLDRIVAGDSIEVTVRLRNYGQAPVTSTTVTYVYNDNFTVTENIDFAAVLESGQLDSYEYYNYTFRQKCRATMGTMQMKAFVDMENDDYRYNDTIFKSVLGISSIVDLKARASIVDLQLTQSPRIQLIVDNVGALACNDFEIGMYIDRDTSTVFRQIVHVDPTFPALTTQFFYFDTILPSRQEPNGYFYVTSWVTHPDDNDHSNDTTSLIVDGGYDIDVQKILVEENMNDECKLRLLIENIGNVIARSSNGATFKVVVNGTTLNVEEGQGPTAVPPLIPMYVDVPGSIPKSPNRTYVGTAELKGAMHELDINKDNDQTSVVEVVNYFGAPIVERDGVSLDQNYPNPFDASTRIDFHIPNPGTVRFFVMDDMGRLVFQSEKDYLAGDNSIHFQPSNLATGVYYYGIEMDDTRLMRKMVYKR